MTVKKHHLNKQPTSSRSPPAAPRISSYRRRTSPSALEVSEQFLEIGRHKGYGPKYVARAASHSVQAIRRAGVVEEKDTPVDLRVCGGRGMNTHQTIEKSSPPAKQAAPKAKADGLQFDDAVREAKQILARIEAEHRQDQMRLGELADKVHTTYGGRSLPKFAKAIGIASCTLHRYRSVYRASDRALRPRGPLRTRSFASFRASPTELKSSKTIPS